MLSLGSRPSEAPETLRPKPLQYSDFPPLSSSMLQRPTHVGKETSLQMCLLTLIPNFFFSSKEGQLWGQLSLLSET